MDLVFLLLLSGCMSTMTVHRPLSPAALASINDEIQSLSAEVRLIDRSTSTASVTVGQEMTWLYAANGTPERVPTSALRRISVTERGRGLLEGLGLGLVGGFVAGGVTGGVSGALLIDSCNASLKREGIVCGAPVGFLIGGLLGAAGGTALGILLGPIIGLATGHDSHIEIEPEK
jgi:hypothetical protein